MNNEDKQLLLKDLCARLPYEVKIHCKWHMFQEEEEREDIGTLLAIDYRKDRVLVKRKFLTTYFYVNRNGCNIKPYLRPMSSMTEEEKRDAAVLLLGGVPYKDKKGEWHTIVHDPSYGEIHTDFDLYNFANGYYGFENVDFLYLHYLDFSGLIPKGLALEAPEGMYKF